MKNLINTAVNSTTSGRQGKFTITSEGSTPRKKTTRSISYSHSDSFINELSISLKECDLDLNDNRTVSTNRSSGKIIHDCNPNSVTHQRHTNLRRLKSWNKGLTKRLRNLEDQLPTSEEIIESLRQQVRYKHKRTTSDISRQWQGIGYNVEDQWKGVGYTVPTTQSESPSTTTRRRQKIVSDLRKISKEHIQAPLRKLSSVTLSRKISDSSLDSTESPVEIIDFGACYSPEEMKTWGQVIDKLATTIRHTNNTAHRRYSNLSDTLNTTLRGSAKRYISGHRNRKSYDCSVRKASENDDKDGGENALNSDIGIDTSSHSSLDLSLSRENLDEDLATSGISFSSNVWYYGELDIDITNNNETTEKESSSFEQGNILVRVDCYGDVVYSITYNLDGDILVGTFPMENSRYCLDFSDPQQPRFSSVKFLLAYLIEQNHLQRVSFSWLIENGVML